MNAKKLVIFLGGIAATVALAASTYTTYYNLEKPADGDANWGGSYRNNLNTIDSQMHINATAISDHIASVTAHPATNITATGAAPCASSDDVEEYLDCLATSINTAFTLTPNRAVVSDGNGDISSSATSSTEIGYVAGVTGSIQSQINAIVTGTGFVRSTGDTMTGNLAISPTTGNGSLTINAATADDSVVVLQKSGSNRAFLVFEESTPEFYIGTSAGNEKIAFRPGGTERFSVNSSSLISGVTYVGTGAQFSDLTASRAVFSDASKNLTSATADVSQAEFAFLDGVTAPIQTQLNGVTAYVQKSGDQMTGSLYLSSGAILVGASSNPNSWGGRFSSNTDAGATPLGVANTNAGSSAAAAFRLENDADVGGILLRNSSANTTYAGASSVNLGTVLSHNLGLITNNTLRLMVTSSGETRFMGTSSGYVGVQSPAGPTSYTITLPTGVAASNNSYLSSTTAGVTSWQTITSPTIQSVTATGAGTYTTPANVKWIKVKIVGGGGGGFGANGSATSGGTGGNTTFGTSLLVANGGVGSAGVLSGGAGGTASISSPAYGSAFTGATGNGGQQNSSASTTVAGGAGGSSCLGGAGRSAANSAGGTAVANSGSGGSGAGGTPSNDSGGGGGAGGCVEAIVPAPLDATYSYSVGTAGAAGGGTTAGGAGAAGYLIVEEHYQ